MDSASLILAFLLAMEPISLDKMEVADRIREGRPTTPETISAPAEIKSKKAFTILAIMKAMGVSRPELTALAQSGQTAPAEFTAAVTRARQAEPDVAQKLLACYHHSARLKTYQILGDWRPAWQYGADHSLVFRLNYSGATGAPYSMDVAIASKPDGQTRAFVISDGAFIPYNKKCELEVFSPPASSY